VPTQAEHRLNKPPTEEPEPHSGCGLTLLPPTEDRALRLAANQRQWPNTSHWVSAISEPECCCRVFKRLQQLPSPRLWNAGWQLHGAHGVRPRMRSRVCLTVTASCRTVSNRRGVSENPDLRRFPPSLTLVIEVDFGYEDTYCWYVSY
jgi:hypothetical protein